MAYFPLFISLEGLPCLVIGGGRVALRKIRTLSEFGAQITVVAPEILPELEALSGLRLIRRRFEEKDLEHMSLVFAASSDQECNRKAARLARKKGIRVNAADLPEECDFFFPALVKRGDVTVGISTGGRIPAVAAGVRARIEQTLAEDLTEFSQQMGDMRKKIMESGACAKDHTGYQRRIKEYFEKYEDGESGNKDQCACAGTDETGHPFNEKQGAGAGI